MIQEELDGELPEAEERVSANVFSWGMETPDNQVVVTVREGHAAAVRPLLDEYGDAVRIEESDVPPTPANHGVSLARLYGGIGFGTQYGDGCSVGFNVRYPDNGPRYFLSAGHCYATGTSAYSHGKFIGPQRLPRHDRPAEPVLLLPDRPYALRGASLAVAGELAPAESREIYRHASSVPTPTRSAGDQPGVAAGRAGGPVEVA